MLRGPRGRASITGRLAFLKKQYARWIEENPQGWYSFLFLAATWLGQGFAGDEARAAPALERALQAISLTPAQIPREGALQHIFRFHRASWGGHLEEGSESIPDLLDWWLFTRADLNQFKTWQQVHAQVNQWHASLGLTLSGETVPLNAFKKTVLDLANGWTWYANCPIGVGKAIGRALGHCYQYSQYEHYIPNNIFLLTSTGRPLVTIELIPTAQGPTVGQVRMVQNRAPTPNYHPAVEAVLTTVIGDPFKTFYRWGAEGRQCISPRPFLRLPQGTWMFWRTGFAFDPAVPTSSQLDLYQRMDFTLGWELRNQLGGTNDLLPLHGVPMSPTPALVFTPEEISVLLPVIQFLGSDPARWGALTVFAPPKAVRKFRSGHTIQMTGLLCLENQEVLPRWPTPTLFDPSGAMLAQLGRGRLVQWGRAPIPPPLLVALLSTQARLQDWPVGTVHLLTPEVQWRLFQRDPETYKEVANARIAAALSEDLPNIEIAHEKDYGHLIEDAYLVYEGGHIVLHARIDEDVNEWDWRAMDAMLDTKDSRWRHLDKLVEKREGRDLFEVFVDDFGHGALLTEGASFEMGDWEAPNGPFGEELTYHFYQYQGFNGTKAAFFRALEASSQEDLEDEANDARSYLVAALREYDAAVSYDAYQRVDRFLDIVELKYSKQAPEQAKDLEAHYHKQVAQAHAHTAAKRAAKKV